MMKQYTAEVHGLQVAYAVGPSAGPPVVLLHGAARSWVDWTPVLSSVGVRWQIWAPDARGHGGSGRARGKYQVKDYIDDAVGFLAAHLQEPALLWGHSLGAMVAAAVAAATPKMVRGVVLEDPPYQTMGRRIRETGYPALFAGMHQAVLAGGTVDELAERLSLIELPVPGTEQLRRLGDLRDPAAIRLSARCLSRLDPQVLLPLIEGTWLDGHDYQDVFIRVKCPTLLVQADSAAGGALSDHDAALAESLISNCQRVRLKGVGHLAHWLDTPGMLSLFHGFAESLR